MSDYNLAPKSIVDELAQFIRKVDGNNRMGAGALADKICERFHVAAPAMQGEPVGEVRLELGAQPYVFAELYSKSLSILAPGTKLYAAPQPAEQQPSADALTPVPDELFAAEFSAWWEQHGKLCRAGGGDYERTFAFEAWRYLYPQLMKLQKVAAEQQPAPDVAGLVQQHRRDSAELRRLCRARDEQRDGRLAALERAAKAESDVAALVEAITMARETIASALRASAPDYFTTDADIARHVVIQRIDAALAAHRKQGGEV